MLQGGSFLFKSGSRSEENSTGYKQKTKYVDCDSLGSKRPLCFMKLVIFGILAAVLSAVVADGEKLKDVSCSCPCPTTMAQNEIHDIADHGNLNITCFIKDECRQNYKASDIHFEKNELIYNSSSHEFKILNNHTVSLVIKQAEHDTWYGHITCKVPTCPIDINFSCQQQITADVRFRRDPLEPYFNSCVVLNWEELRCEWGPTRRAQIEHTLSNTHITNKFTYELLYTESDTTKDCKCQNNTTNGFCGHDNQLNETCVLQASNSMDGTNHFLMGRKYTISVRANTEIGGQDITCWPNISCKDFPKTFDTNEHVKPNPPESLEMKMADFSVLLLWKPPSTSWKSVPALTYNINLTNELNKTMVMMYTTDTNITMTTSPMTTYTASVRVKPANSGYWSDAANFQKFTTQTSVPVSAPVVSPVGYEVVTEDCSDRCKVVLYWQPIPDYYKGAEDFQYYAVIKQANGRQKRESTADQRLVMAAAGVATDSMEIPIESDAQVYIATKNRMGEGEQSKDAIQVEKQGLTVEEVLVAERHDTENVTADITAITLSVDKSPSSEQTTIYTAFWRKSKEENDIQGTHDSKPGVQWRDIEPVYDSNNRSKLSLDLSLPQGKYVYGLAKRWGSNNSGIVWNSNPVYLYSGSGGAVQSVTAQATGEREMEVTWVDPVYNINQGYIWTYKVQYCQTEDQKNDCLEGGVIQELSVRGTLNKAKVTGLEPGKRYRFLVSSHTRAGQPSYSSPVYAHTHRGLSQGVVAGICVAAVVVLILLLIGIFAVYKRCKSMKKWYETGIKIQMPQDARYADSESSETPFLPRNFQDPYHRTLSSMSSHSMDSGQWSLPPDDELTLSVSGYARGGYLASPTPPLRSIPEDTDEVFTNDTDQGENHGVIPHTYRLGPAPPRGGGYISTNGSECSRTGSDNSRSGISKYTAVAMGQELDHSAQFPVAFKVGEERVRINSINSDDSQASPTSPNDGSCAYTQIQVDTQGAKKKPYNPFSKMFNVRRPGRNKFYKPSTGYMANDGSFDPRKGTPARISKLAMAGGYVRNDGSFDPKSMPVFSKPGPVTGYVVNDGTFDPKTVPSKVEPQLSNYVVNDGTFNPRLVPTQMGPQHPSYVANDGSFEPSLVPNQTDPQPSSYVSNDGTFDPSLAANQIDPQSSSYVANDGTFDPKTVPVGKQQLHSFGNGSKTDKWVGDTQPTSYVANDGTFDPSSIITQPQQSGYVPNDGSFDPEMPSSVPQRSSYVANDDLFNPQKLAMQPLAFSSRSSGNVDFDYEGGTGPNTSNDLIGYVANNGMTTLPQDNSAAAGYVANNGSIDLSDLDLSQSQGHYSSETPNGGSNCGGYLPDVLFDPVKQRTSDKLPLSPRPFSDYLPHDKTFNVESSPKRTSLNLENNKFMKGYVPNNEIALGVSQDVNFSNLQHLPKVSDSYVSNDWRVEPSIIPQEKEQPSSEPNNYVSHGLLLDPCDSKPSPTHLSSGYVANTNGANGPLDSSGLKPVSKHFNTVMPSGNQLASTIPPPGDHLKHYTDQGCEGKTTQENLLKAHSGYVNSRDSNLNLSDLSLNSISNTSDDSAGVDYSQGPDHDTVELNNYNQETPSKPRNGYVTFGETTGLSSGECVSLECLPTNNNPSSDIQGLRQNGYVSHEDIREPDNKHISKQNVNSSSDSSVSLNKSKDSVLNEGRPLSECFPPRTIDSSSTKPVFNSSSGYISQDALSHWKSDHHSNVNPNNNPASQNGMVSENMLNSSDRINENITNQDTDVDCCHDNDRCPIEVKPPTRENNNMSKSAFYDSESESSTDNDVNQPFSSTQTSLSPYIQLNV